MITRDEFLRFPAPRRLPWVMRWYLCFRTPSTHVLWGIFVFILLFSLCALPEVIRNFWNVGPLRGLFITTTATITDAQHTTGSSETADSHAYTYHFTDLAGREHRQRDSATRRPNLSIGSTTTVAYLHGLPSFSLLPDLHEPEDGAWIVGITAIFLLPSLLIVGLALKFQNHWLRLLKYGQVAPGMLNDQVAEETEAWRYRFVDEAGREWTGDDVAGGKKHQGDTALVLYNARRPQENMLLSKQWDLLPCRLDDRGRVRLLPANPLFVAVLPAVYLSVLLLPIFGLVKSLIAAAIIILLLFAGLRAAVDPHVPKEPA